MCRFLLIPCFFVLCSFLSFSQASGVDFTSKTEKIKLDQDTVWIINTGYDLYHKNFKLTLDFTEQSPAPTKIKWDASSSEENVVTPQMTHTYEEGLYDLQLTDANSGTIYHYMIFNKMLTADFKIFPDPFKFCFEADGDSLLIIKQNFSKNILGTEYEIVVEGPAPLEDGVDILCEVSDWFGPQSDSAWVVFKQQTGVKPCDVYLKLSYSDESKGIDLVEETNSQKVSVYRAPNVRKIFDFKEPEAGAEIKNMVVCTGTHQDYLNLNEDTLNYYQYKKGSSAPIPYYASYDKAKDFEVHYFYSDTLYDGMPENVWREVTGKADTVSVTAEVGFFIAGYYKMMITADNICNEVGGIKIDTLWTEKVSGSEEKRYFQVFSYDDTKISCKSDTVCMNITDSIVIVDYNARRGFEAPPEYSFSSDEYDLSADATITYRIWRDGKIINMPEAETSGCDSTVIYIRLNRHTFYGELNLNMNRGGNVCGSSERSFKINVGRKPAVGKDKLYQDLVENYGILFNGAVYNHCDTFQYKMPLDSLLLPVNTRGFQLDSVYFYIRQGTAGEDSLIYRQGDDGVLTQWFDSTDVRSCVRIRSFNVCGWAEDSIELRINARPKVELWRDSVSHNDSLCIGLAYPYYWNGKLPKDYKMFLTPSEAVYVNGVLRQGGVQITVENGDSIRHTLTGTVEERFLIQNTNMPSCALDSIWKAEVLSLPDTLLHPDSVGYCSGSLELNTIKLFETGKSDFKWGEWKLNGGEVKKEQLPAFNLTGGVDTLRYKLSRSKGCYVKGQLLLRPQTAPELELHDKVHYCLPASIRSFREETAIVQKLSDWAGGNRLTVYEDKIAPSTLRYQDQQLGPVNSNYELSEELDGKKFIYEIENIRVDTALMGKCRLLDTVSFSISTPKVKVLKSDVLKHPWESFGFAHLENDHFIDTAHVNPSTIKWTLRPEGTSWSGLYSGTYTLQAADKAKDTLLFELSAESYCGVELKDTLIVELNHLKIKGYKDTICSNEKDYPLWDKVKWSYVDLTSVQWKIDYPLVSTGTITGTGSTATYTPGDGTDSVRISFEAALTDVPTEKMRDTVVLIINPAPVLKFLQDTLWACDKRVNLAGISSAYLYSAHTKGIVHGDYVLKPGQSRVGGWSGNDYVFPDNLANFGENLSQKVAYEARGLDGCKNAIDTVVLVQPVPVKLEFKRAHEEMCAGDRIKLDTLYTLEGMDRFGGFDWSLASDASGHYEDGHYVASQPEDKTQELRVTTHKSYTCYTGNPSGPVLQTGPVSLPLTVHREPEFQVNHRFDTLCRNISVITIRRDWVTVGEGLYPDYQDSVRVNGLRLLNDGINYSVNTEGAHEKLVVTVAQGRCNKWKAQSDTISLYRLPAMLGGSFSVNDVCEGGQSEIDKTNLTISPLAIDVKWTATGGFITADNRYFVPANDIREAFVRLAANAPHDCGTESLPDVPVNIGRKPQLQTKEYTVCRLVGHPQLIAAGVTDPTVQVQKIDWYRCGTPDEYIMTTGESEPEWSFTVSAADTLQPELRLLAKIQCGGACQGIFVDTVRIHWQEKPSVTVLSPITVCQAEPVGIDLSAKVQVGHAGLVAWDLQTPAAGTLDGSVFWPGEYSGTAVVNVKAPGLLGCPDEIEPVTITVHAAPISGIVADGENCTQRQVRLRPGSTKAEHYDWDFGDATQIDDVVGPVSHTYGDANTYTISMVAHFENRCTRQETKSWLVHPTPQANFLLPDFTPIAKPVSISSISLPETVSCKWAIDAVSSYVEPSISHIFTAAGSHKVELVVTSPEGCTDTLAQSTIVLGKPVADFDVEVDSCSGIVKIVNHSIRNGATVAWDFGNGQSISDVWQPTDQSYPLVWKDTLYTIRLTLSNISDTVKVARTFKMISRLEPDFEMWSNADLCNKTEKEIRILTKGKADTTYVDWGDGTEADVWPAADQIHVLAHTYPENVTTSLMHYTIKFRSVNACYHPVPVESAVSIVPQQIRAKVMEEEELAAYKNKCYGHDRAFRNKSFGFIPQGYTCEWDFGDKTPLETDTVSTEPKVHLFERPGAYTIRLRVKDECNERLDSVKIVVHGNDSLDFAFEKDNNKLCTGDSIRLWFVQRGKEPFTDLRWDLPDGTHRQADTIYYKFNEPGPCVVSLKAQADGCPENPLPKSCFVRQTPDPLIDYATAETETCTPLKMPFRAVNLQGSTEDMKIFWDFGDGSSSQDGLPPMKIYETAGRYVVKLRMTSAEECVAWDSIPVIAKITPEAKLELDRHLVCSPDGNFKILALNRTAAPEDCSFEWYKGDEVISMHPEAVTIPFEHYYGKEKVSLRAVHKLSQCESKATDSIVASYPVKAGLWVSPDTVCAGMDVMFKDTSTIAGTIRQLVFDDGSVEEEQEVTRTYWDAGKYAYRFVVTNPAGCTDTIRDTVYVNSLPVANFDWEKDHSVTGIEGITGSDVENGGVRFTNTSEINFLNWEKAGLYYRWDFGDGHVSGDKEPVHLFANNGSYEVWLHAVSQMGCRDSISHLIDISTMKGLFFPNAMMPASNDPGINRFQPKGIGLHTFTLKIYAPNGSCVWQTDKLDDGRPAEYWDGTFNGQIVPAGVYNWDASALFIDGSVQNHLNGTLIVIR